MIQSGSDAFSLMLKNRRALLTHTLSPLAKDLLVSIGKGDKTLYSEYELPGITNILCKQGCVHL